MEDKKVAILLSSYNGSQYIKSQIESLLTQSYKNWSLYIRDDGSSDETIEIIKEYEKNHHNINVIEDSIKHRGIKDSFIYLLRHVTADFYMFCDQDDIWLKDKIKISVNNLFTENDDIASLLATDLTLVDKDLNLINESMWTYCKMQHKVKNLKYLEVIDYLTGCTMCFNHAAKEEILKLNENLANRYLHDQIATLALMKSKGRIKILQESTILYRQHTKNIVGGNRIDNKFLYRLINFSDLIKRDYERFNTAHDLFNTSIFRYIILRFKSIIN